MPSPIAVATRVSSSARRTFQRVPVNHLVSWLLPALLVSSLSTLVFSQANINEGLETAYVYVDTNKGNDSNPGTEQEPLKTIGAAASMAESNNYISIGTRVTINPGTYRENISLSHSTRDTSLPITFEAATNGTVIVSGGVVYTGWSKYSENNSIYTTSWNNNWGECAQLSSCPYQQDIMMRQEMVAVNGTAMTQVMSLVQMLQGTFYVDESSDLLYVWPPTGTNMSTATVEAASLPNLFSISHKTNIVVRGIVFQYANSCRGAAAVSVQGESSNILFDSDTFQWNNAQGISINDPTQYFTVENSSALHNGDTGLQESQSQYGLWQSDTTSYNNWRGAQAAYYACNTAGMHGWEAHEDTINNLTVSFNEAYGIHWDTDNVAITTTGINATGNLMSGLFVEKDPGPVTLSKAYICNQNSTMAVGGLVLRNSPDVSLTNSVLMNNSPNQITVIGILGGIEVTDWITGVTTNLFTQNFTNTSNTIQGNSSGQGLFKDSYLNGSDWTDFQTTFVSSKNTWWNAYNSTTPYVVPTPKMGDTDDFSGWQGVTGQDSNSSFKQPSGSPGAACNLTPTKDYWITSASSLLTTSPGGNSVAFDLAVTPLNFTGTVNLTLDGISEVKGLSATLSPNSIKTSGTSTLTITASSKTAAGTYSITVIANSGSITHTVTVQVTVS